MADLTVTIKEDITLNNINEGAQYDRVYTGIENIFKTWGTVQLGATVDVYDTAVSTFAGSTVETDGTKYIRFTNMASGSQQPLGGYTGSNSGSVTTSMPGVNLIRLKISGSGGIAWTSLGPGDSFILTQHSKSFQGSSINVDSYYSIFNDIAKVQAFAQGSDTNYYIFAAGIAVT